MFNLGTKQVVLNSTSNVTIATPAGVAVANAAAAAAGDIITVAGFGTFTIPTDVAAAARVGAITVASNAVAGVYTLTPTFPLNGLGAAAYDPTKAYDIVLGIRSPRKLSNIFTDGDVWTFQSKPGAATIGEAFAAGQIAGFNTDILKFSGTTTVIITFQPGYEGVYIETVEMREVTLSERAVAISPVITTAPSEGVGLGRHVEEEVQNATFENLDPYGSKGGNETVDVRGKYTEILWTAVAENDDSPGWAPHEMMGYGDANTAATYAPRSFAAYVNEVSGAAAIATLSLLVTGKA